MASLLYLGIDTALVNNGISVIEEPHIGGIPNSKVDVVSSIDNHTPKDGYWNISDITKAAFQKKTVIDALGTHTPAAIALESPAYSYMGTMQISIGIIHGVLTDVVNSTGKPWLWVAPTQWKYALLGKGKHSKAEHIGFVKDHFNIPSDFLNSKKSIDDNQADSICLAYMAYVCHKKATNSPFFYWQDADMLKRIGYVFDRKKEGIMLHGNSRIFNFNL